MAGYCADRFGHKQVLMFSAIMYAAFGTLIDQTPRYHEYQNSPFVELSRDGHLVTFNWPHCQEHNCTADSEAIHDFAIGGSWQSDLMGCQNLTITLPQKDEKYSVSPVTLINGTFCSMQFTNETDTWRNCELKIEDDSLGMRECENIVGDHRITFAIYAVLVLGCRAGMNICFSLMDGTNMRYAQRYNGDFAKTYAFSALGSLLSSFLSGFLVVDATDGQGISESSIFL